MKKIKNILALSLLMITSQAYANEKIEELVPVAPVEAPAVSSPKTEEKPEESVSSSSSSGVEKPVEQPAPPAPSTNVGEEKPARSTYVVPAQTPPLRSEAIRQGNEEIISSSDAETTPSSSASSETSSSTASSSNSSSEKKEASVTKPDKADTKEVKDETGSVKDINDKLDKFEKGKVTAYDVMHVSFVSLLLLSFVVVAFIKRDKDGYKEI